VALTLREFEILEMIGRGVAANLLSRDRKGAVSGRRDLIPYVVRMRIALSGCATLEVGTGRRKSADATTLNLGMDNLRTVLNHAAAPDCLEPAQMEMPWLFRNRVAATARRPAFLLFRWAFGLASTFVSRTPALLPAGSGLDRLV
jgi:hypothetical protein